MMSAGDELQRTIDEYRSILNETVQNWNDDLH